MDENAEQVLAEFEKMAREHVAHVRALGAFPPDLSDSVLLRCVLMRVAEKLVPPGKQGQVLLLGLWWL